MQKINWVNTVKILSAILAMAVIVMLFYLQVNVIVTLIYIGIAIACVAFLSLFKIRYDFIVFLDMFLLCAVIFEPSPTDVVFCGLLVFGFTNKVLDLSKIKKQGFLLLLLFIYLFVSILGIIGATDIFIAIKYYAITFYLVLFCSFIYLYCSKQNYINLIRAYVLSTTFSSILAFVGYLGYFPEILLTYSYRVKGLFKDPNVFGPFIVPTVIILLDDLRERKIIKSNTFIYYLIIATNTIAIVLSFSRAAWINLAIAVLTYLVLNFRRLNIRRLIIFSTVFLIIATAFFVFTENKQLKDSFEERSKLQNYDKNRFASQRAGIELASQKPIGYGPGQFELEVIKLTNENLSAHNLYIRVLLENGVAGFIFFFTAIGLIIFKLYKAHRIKNKDVFLRSSVLVAILIGIMVNSLVVDTLHWRHFWFFLGLSLFNITENSSLDSDLSKIVLDVSEEMTNVKNNKY